MTEEKMKHPRTHRWIRRREDAPPLSAHADEQLPEIKARVPEGDKAEAAVLEESIRAALAGWPIVVLRMVGTVERSFKVGKQPARWLRKDLVGIVDALLCTCPGDRCIEDACTANRLLGRHGKTGRADGEAWAPFVIRAADSPQGMLERGARMSYELVFAGADAVREVGTLVRALGHEGQPFDLHPVRWRTIQALNLGDDGELRWRNVSAETREPPVIALDKLPEPRLRSRRLTMTFLTATAVARQGERGTPSPDLSLVLDRMTRSLGAWMGRTGHRGPRLPVDDILRAAQTSKLRADNRRTLDVPDALLAAPGAKDFRASARGTSDGTTALLGSITWAGDFSGLGPLLRTIQYLGMGPGRQHGLGQVAFR